jgi:Pyruvate/2-oxoacid:ferredoxin oxidoreductase delta subunit
MCENCRKHGEGKIWYLQAKNYSEDLKHDLERQHGVFDWKFVGRDLERWERVKKAPFFISALQEPRIAKRIHNMHFGQVLPMEDVEQIFSIVNNVVRLPCVCRAPRKIKEQRYCYGISLIPQNEAGQKVVNKAGSGYRSGPDNSRLEQLNKEDALAQIRSLEKEGLCHSVWTELTPFITGICNCDRQDCGALQNTLIKGMPMMFRAEYVAELDLDLCSGCRSCMKMCQFGAITYSSANEKVWVDISRCFGCGVCRSACAKGALKLVDRAKVPAVASLW